MPHLLLAAVSPSNADSGTHLMQPGGTASKSAPSSSETPHCSDASSSSPHSLPLRLFRPLQKLQPRVVPNAAPNASPACGSFAAGRRIQQHSKEEWEEMKTTLQRWYIDEDLPLKTVMERAREGGFGAT